MKYAFDIDGVACDIITPAQRIFLAERGVNFLRQATVFNPDLGLPPEDTPWVQNVWRRSLAVAKPYKGAIEALAEVYEVLGAPIMFITARDPLLDREVTYSWLKHHIGEAFPYAVSFVRCQNKALLLHDHGFTALVEDRLANANDAAVTLGQAFLVDRRWNRGRPTAPGVVRVKHLRDVVNHLKREKEAA